MLALVGEFIQPVEGFGLDLDVDAPENFEATQVIYREIAFFNGSHFRFVDKPQPINVETWTGIEDHVRNIIQNGYTPGTADLRENKPLAIPVRADSYIVLSVKGNVIFPYFSDLGPAVDLKPGNPAHPPADSLYGQLRHYNAETDTFTAEPCAQCEYVFFSAAVSMTAGYSQELYFNVLDAAGTPYKIDPDIRYPGNGGGAEGGG